MIATILIVLIGYILLISSFIYGFDKVPLFQLKTLKSKTKFTIVIPFRNEAKNLTRLIDSMKLLDYPKSLYEIIFIDDASNDHSVSIINNGLRSSQINYHILVNVAQTKSPKKDAINLAVKHSNHDWIITSDADCILPIKWLQSYDEFIQEERFTVIAGPVTYTNSNSFFEAYQFFDFMSLMGTTIGAFGLKSPFLANGANLAYKKAFFFEINGFAEDFHIASGDDVFLLQKATKLYPDKVGFLKCYENIVYTKPVTTWQDLTSQRIRWASKATSYNNTLSIYTGLIVLLANAMLIILIFLTLTNGVPYFILVLFFLAKISIDFILISKSTRFFKFNISYIRFLLSSLLYPFFTTYVAFLSIFKGYKWKNRSFYK